MSKLFLIFLTFKNINLRLENFRFSPLINFPVFSILSMMFLLFCAYASICKLFIVSSSYITLSWYVCIIWENFSQFSLLFLLFHFCPHLFTRAVSARQATQHICIQCLKGKQIVTFYCSPSRRFYVYFHVNKTMASRACELNTRKVFVDTKDKFNGKNSDGNKKLTLRKCFHRRLPTCKYAKASRH